MLAITSATVSRSAVIATACALLFAAAGWRDASAGRQWLFRGPMTIGSLTVQTVKFHVPGDWMHHPRVEGRLVASGGSGNDIEALVLRGADLPEWEKHGTVTPLHASGRITTIDFDVSLPGPGAYAIVLSNRFSKLSSKRVDGSLQLVWDEDPALASGAALRARVQFLDATVGPGGLAAPVSADDSTRRVRFERLGEDARSGFAVTVRRREGAATVVRSVGRYDGVIEEVGTVDLHADGDRDVFLVGSAADSGGRRRDLVMICPRQFGMLDLAFVSAGDSAAPEVRYGDTFADPRFVSEQSFLERIKSAYDPSGAGREPEPRTATSTPFGDWLRDNGSVRSGAMTIRRLPGRPADLGRVAARLVEGAVTYTAHESSGVVAYDAATDEHYALFHPADREAWPTVLRESGPWLVIGTRGEGLALVDRRTFRLERVRPGGVADTVRTLEVDGATLRVNGGTAVEIPHAD